MKRKELGVRFGLERTARAVLAIWAARGIALGAIPFLPLGSPGLVDRAVAFLGVYTLTRTRERNRAFTPRVRARLSGESETTTQEDDDTQLMVGV
jgi:hypothetical protein